jgi:hypothetical protein
LALAGILFLGSCQEIEEIPIVLEDSLEVKFDRLMFLGAVNKATAVYVEEARNPDKSKNFRTIHDTDVVVHDYIDNIAAEYNTSSQWFQTLPEDSWNDPYNGQVFANEVFLDKNNLSPRLKMHVDSFENSLNSVANQYENGSLTDDQVLSQVKSLTKIKGNKIKSDGIIPLANRNDIAEIFYIIEEMTGDIMLVLDNPNFHNARLFNKKWFRAVIRVILVAAVTAAVIYTGGAALSLLKVGSIGAAKKAGLAAIMKKVAVGSGKLYLGLIYGLGKGIINAGQKWDDEWSGVLEEGKYGVKIAW